MGAERNANNNVDVVVGQNDRPGSRVFDLERAGVTSGSYVVDSCSSSATVDFLSCPRDDNDDDECRQ